MALAQTAGCSALFVLWELGHSRIFHPRKWLTLLNNTNLFPTPDVVLWQNESVLFKRNPVNAKSDIKKSFKMQAFNRMWWA